MKSANTHHRHGIFRILGLSAALVSALLLFGCGGGSDAPAGLNTSDGPPAQTLTTADQPAEIGQAKGEPGKGKLEPCSLLTKADAESIIGEAAKAGEHPSTPTNYIGQSLCFYGAVAERSIASAQISVVRNETIDERARKNGVNARRIFDEAKSFAGSAARPVDGVGDAAFLSGRKIEVVKGNAYITISAMFKGLPDAMTPVQEAALLDAARKAVERL